MSTDPIITKAAKDHIEEAIMKRIFNKTPEEEITFQRLGWRNSKWRQRHTLQQVRQMRQMEALMRQEIPELRPPPLVIPEPLPPPPLIIPEPPPPIIKITYAPEVMLLDIKTPPWIVDAYPAHIISQILNDPDFQKFVPLISGLDRAEYQRLHQLLVYRYNKKMKTKIFSCYNDVLFPNRIS